MITELAKEYEDNPNVKRVQVLQVPVLLIDRDDCGDYIAVIENSWRGYTTIRTNDYEVDLEGEDVMDRVRERIEAVLAD